MISSQMLKTQFLNFKLLFFSALWVFITLRKLWPEVDFSLKSHLKYAWASADKG